MQPARSRLITVVLKTLLPSGQPRYTELKLDMLAVEAAGHDATSSRRDWLEAATEKIIELLDTGIKRLDPGASIHASEKRESIKAIAHNIHNYAAYDGIVLALNGRFNPPAAPSDPGPARELADSRRELEWYKIEYPKLQHTNDRLQQRVNEMEPEFKEHRVFCAKRPTPEELDKWKSEATAYKDKNQELRVEIRELEQTIPNLEERERLARESENRSAQALVDARNRITDLIQRVNMLAQPGTKPIDPGADTTLPQPGMPVSGIPVSGMPVQGSAPQSVKEPSPQTTPADMPTRAGVPTLEEARAQRLADQQKEFAHFQEQLADIKGQLGDAIAERDKHVQDLMEKGKADFGRRGGGTVKTIDDKEEEQSEIDDVHREHERSTDSEAIATHLQFTAFHPRIVQVAEWQTLLVYIHVPSAISAIRDDAAAYSQGLGATARETSIPSTRPILPGTRISIAPYLTGVLFDPEEVTISWTEEWHRANFRFRADDTLAGTAGNGEIAFYVGPLVVATLRLPILFENHPDHVILMAQLSEPPMRSLQTTAAPTETTTNLYGRVFPSYSHKDKAIVTACRNVYRALGLTVTMDIDVLRAGQRFDEKLMAFIESADVFQLFWSKNSARSEFVRREWTHALDCGKGEEFIRPVYWDAPMVAPPKELSALHFAQLSIPNTRRRFPSLHIRS